MTQGQTARRPTRGVRNNNPGNIRRVSGVTWQGQAKDQTDAEFVVYVSPEMGVRALVRTLLTYNKAHKLGVAAGKILAPAVGAAATVLESVSNWMSRAGESESFLAKAAVWAVAGLAGAVGNAVVGILGPLFIAKTMLGPGGLGGAAFKAGAAQVIGLFGRMRLAAIGFNLSMLANPVVLIGAAAVAAVVGVGLVVRKYWEPIKAFFGGLQARFSGWGRMILQSLINGIRSMTGSVKNAVMETASSAVGWFKSGLGIRSPSRLFMGLGGDTIAGLTLGLDRGGRTAVRRVAAIGAAVVGAMPVAGAALPAIAQPAASAMSAASAAPAGPRTGGVHIETLTIHVSVQSGGTRPRAAGSTETSPPSCGADCTTRPDP